MLNSISVLNPINHQAFVAAVVAVMWGQESGVARTRCLIIFITKSPNFICQLTIKLQIDSIRDGNINETAILDY